MRILIYLILFDLIFGFQSAKGQNVNISGVVKTSGRNNVGQLGSNSFSSIDTFYQIGTNKNFTTIVSGNYHNIGIKTDSTLWAWGGNLYGQLGIGNNSYQSIAVQIGSDKWKTIDAGEDYSIGIKSDGSMWAWGFNSQGQLGIGSNTSVNYPIRVGNKSDWKQISCGGNGISLGIRADGTLWSWGYNFFGALGLGNTTNYNTPQQVGTDTSWKCISAGSSFSIAIKSNGSLWGWGANSFGQLTNITSGTNIPTQIGSDLNWKTISAGYNYVLSIKTDSTLWVWGYNYYGQLGVGNNNNSSSPIQIGKNRKWGVIAAGYRHAIFVTGYGELWVSGYNDYGQLGLNNTNNLNTLTSSYSATNKLINAACGFFHSVVISTKFLPNTWNGTANINSSNNWSTKNLPNKDDSVIILSGTLTVNQSTNLDIMTVLGGSTVKLEAPLTVRNLHIKNGTVDLNGYKLTVTGRIYQSTDSTNYYIQAGTSASQKPRSELIIKPSTAANSTVYFNPNVNRLNRFEIGNGSAAAQITLGNSLKIKGGEDGGNGPGLVTVNKNAKIVIPSGSSLTLESDTFNASLNLAQPAQKSIVCTGTGKFNIERDHYGVRGWRLYSHPFKTDIDLQEVANDIELIGPGGTAEGFYSNTYTNSSAYWYDYSKADSSAATDPAWTPFTSAKGTTLSGNANKWKKNSPLLLFNPGNRRGTDAFGSPSTATYENGKITLSYTLDSTSVHLNDGVTQAITVSNIPSYVPTNGLVGYWPFNGNAKDESGNGNNGTIQGSMTFTTDRYNVGSRAVYGDGSSSIEINPSNMPLGSNSRTISLFFKVDNLPSLSSNRELFAYGFNSPGQRFGLMLKDDKIGIEYAIPSNLTTWTADTNWHHLVVCYVKSTDSIFVYLDNNKIINSRPSTTVNTTSCCAFIGSLFGPINSFVYSFKGKIDELSIWNRALSASEISALYNASSNSNISNKSKYFFITNPFTTPVKLCGIQGLNSSNVDPYFYYWKQRRNTVTDNFSPAEWQSEKIVVGNNTRDSNIAIPAFGMILVRLKNSSTTFTIPESAKQLTNFGYIIGGAKGVSKTGLMFADATGSDIGPNGVEIKLLVNDSQEADRVLIYNEANQSPAYTNYDAAKYLNQDFPNVYTLSADNKPLSIDMQDIKAQLDAGQPEVTIPLGVNREANKRFATLKWELSENTSGLEIYLKDLQTETTEPWSTGVVKNIALDQQGLTTKRYALVFKQQLSSNENFATIVGQPMIQVYPNPTEDNWVNVVYSKANSKSQYRIFDMAGKQIMHGMANSKFKIDIGSMSKGAYILSIDQNSQFFIKN